MAEKLLLVDDEPRVLAGYRRALRQQCRIETAESGAEALEMLSQGGPYAVVVSDMRMPGMDGIELLEQIKQRWPNTVRVMLTGNAEQQTAVDAVNRGDIFRFLNKPCSPELLAETLRAGIRQHQLLTSEKVLLQQTLRGAINALSEVLALVNPGAFGRTERLRQLVGALARQMTLKGSWQYETAAMLSQIGCVILPEEVPGKVTRGEPLSEEEGQLFGMHPSVGADLIGKIPRLGRIASFIQYQEKHYDGSGWPTDPCTGEDIPIGARLLKLAMDYDQLALAGHDAQSAMQVLRQRGGWYDPKVLEALARHLELDALTPDPIELFQIPADKLTGNMQIAEDVYSDRGVLLCCKGCMCSDSVRMRLYNFAEAGQLSHPLRVLLLEED